MYTQPAHLNALDCCAVHVSAEPLVPEHRQALLQCQLEPVTTRHTVACRQGGGHHGLIVLAAMPEVHLLKHSHSVNTTGDRPQKEGRNQARGVPCKSLAARAEIMESSSSVICVFVCM